ncbi:MAG: LCP family protein [Clostridiales bacterium]|nr:LCP family protein [Clostridiales bacterium]
MKMKKLSKKNIGMAAAVIGVVVLAAGVAVYTHIRDYEDPSGVTSEGPAESSPAAPTFQQTVDPDSESPTADRLILYDGVEYRYRDDIDTLLVIGTDDFELEQEETSTHRNNSQSDLLLVVVFDNTNKTYRIIQINRDTMTGIRKYDAYGQYVGIVNLQIALSHTYGTGGQDSCRDTVYAVSRLLYDSDINNYVSVTMSAVPIFNDLVGGVDVLIEDNFEGVDDTLVMGQTVHLQGDHALTFVRSRMSMTDDATNIARMRRQRTYIVALMEALGEAFDADPDFELRAFSALSDYMVTDMTTDRLEELTDRFNEYGEEAIIVPEGTSVEGDRFMEFYVDEDALQAMVVDTFYEPT